MKTEDIADLYELSPMQQGMLFHSLQLAERGVYVLQFAGKLLGEIDGEAFEGAWKQVVEHHPVLRTTFHWRELDKPLQVVHGHGELRLRELDWSHLDEAAGRAELEAFLVADREEGFDLTELPLSRVALIRHGAERHTLVWTVHHLLLDGWCLALVLRDFALAYEARRRGAVAVLPGHRPFGDYIEWLQGRDKAADEVFWRAELRGVTAPTPLGVDQPGPSLDFAAGYTERRHRVPAAESAGLRAFAARHGLTLNTLVQAAWSRLLALYSGQRQVVHGAVVSGRAAPLEGIGTMVGLFVNTLPVAATVDPGALLAEWLVSVQTRLGRLQDYEHSSLLEIHGWSEVPRGRALFDSVVAFENYPRTAETGSAPGSGAGTDAGAGSLRLEAMEAVERTNFPLSLTVAPGEELALAVCCDAERFDGATAEALLRHVATLLAGLPAAAAGTVAEWSPLTDAERRQVLTEWAGAPRDVGPWKPLQKLFAASVARDPEAPAVIAGEVELSYGEVARRATALAARLRARGVGPESLVGLALGRSERLLIALLAVLEAGGAYLPLDPALPEERLRFLVDDARPLLVLTEELHRPALEQVLDAVPGAVAGGLLLLDGQVLDGSGLDGEDPPVPGADAELEIEIELKTELAPDNRAYVIYTSGSTGRPKGVEVSHRGLHNLAEAQVLAFGLGPSDRLLQFASLNFDASIFEMTMALRAGACLVFAPVEEILPGPPLVRTLRERRITSLTVTPSALEPVDPAAVPELRHVVAAGEACSADLAAAWAPGRRFFNAYGPTEATVWATVERCSGDGRPPTIGRPIANAVVRVVGPDGYPVPARVAGELCLGGPGLARGYLRRPRLTAERFVPDPWAATPGQRLYRTGDLVRWSPVGDLEFLGRIDFQVKLRGFRIELGEIEASLRSHPAVVSAAVLRRDGAGGPRLVAYVVAAGGETPRAEELRHYLFERLPEYMVPGFVTLLDALPMNTSGKLDRAALPEPEGARPELAGFVAPSGELERTVAEIWQQVLGLDAVGVEDNFFDLGGHSLHLFQVHKKLEEALGRELAMTDLFRHPTVAQLAAALSGEVPAADEDAGRQRLEAAEGRRRRQQRRRGTS